MDLQTRRALLEQSQYGKKQQSGARSRPESQLGRTSPQLTPEPPKPVQKYRAKPVVVDGVRYDSTREYERFVELQLLERCGEISGLVYHKVFRLEVNGQLICKYEADFIYYKDGQLVVEDVKSNPTKTPTYLLKRALMLACHGIAIHETY